MEPKSRVYITHSCLPKTGHIQRYAWMWWQEAYHELRQLFLWAIATTSTDISTTRCHISSAEGIFWQHASRITASYAPSSMASTFFRRCMSAIMPCPWDIIWQTKTSISQFTQWFNYTITVFSHIISYTKDKDKNILWPPTTNGQARSTHKELPNETPSPEENTRPENNDSQTLPPTETEMIQNEITNYYCTKPE